MSTEKSTTQSFFDKDVSLFLRLKKFKDRQAFLTAYDKHADAIYRFIYFKIGQEEDARDLTSAVFLRCWSYVQEGKLNDDNEYQSLKAFLYKIARNLVIDYYRQSKPNLSLDEAEDLVDDSQDLSRIDQVIDVEQVKDKLLYLKDDYKTLIIMRYINELSIKEISQITGKTKGNVRIMIMRALKILKNLLEQDHERPGTTEPTK